MWIYQGQRLALFSSPQFCLLRWMLAVIAASVEYVQYFLLVFMAVWYREIIYRAGAKIGVPRDAPQSEKDRYRDTNCDEGNIGRC